MGMVEGKIYIDIGDRKMKTIPPIRTSPIDDPNKILKPNISSEDIEID